MSDTHLIVGMGDVGTALARLLIAGGNRVVGIRRDPSAAPDDLEVLAGDVTASDGFPLPSGGVDVVHYLVAAGGRDPESYRRAYVRGVANTLGALDRAGAEPRRFLFVSSTATYGHTDGAVVDETSPTEPLDHRGVSLLEGERLVAGSRHPSCAVRFAGIYGPGRFRLIRSVVDGPPRCRRVPPEWTNRIHRDDCAGLLAHLAGPDPTPPVVLGVDDEPAPRCDVLTWLAGRLGVDGPVEVAEATVGRANKRCSNALMRAIDYDLTHPTYREGFVGVIEEWRRQGG